MRQALKERKVRFWQLADFLGISASTLTVWLRHELDDDKQNALIQAVETISEAR